MSNWNLGPLTNQFFIMAKQYTAAAGHLNLSRVLNSRT